MKLGSMNPETIIGGIAALFNFTFADYSADDGCSIRAILAGGSAQVDIETANGDGDGTAWELTIPAAKTTGLSGSYTLLVLATDGTTEVVVANLAVKIVASTATDMRSTARVTLEALEAMLEGKASKDQASVSYNGRSISRLSLEEVQAAIVRQRNVVRREENRAAGKRKIQSVGLRFTNG